MILEMRSAILSGILTCLSFPGLDGVWLERKAEGWFWYEDRETQQLKEPEEAVLSIPPIPDAIPPLTATEEMTLIRKELEERLNRAILEPTEANVMAYMHMQQEWINQAAQFSQVWLRNLLNNAALDSRLTAGPVTQYGVQVQKQILREQREERITTLAKSHGLFFFYEGNQKISQAFSFVVKEFSKKYDWQVVAISCDGIFIPGFGTNQTDQGITQRLNIERFPSLFLVDPKRQQVLPIAFGLSSVDQIEDNIEIQLPAHRNHL